MRRSILLGCLLLSACIGLRPTVVSPGAVLFEDDFSDPKSGWNRGGGTDYADGVYQITVDEPDTTIWANPKKSFKDVVVEVDATTAAGPADNDFGVQCRVKDDKNYYFFLISADGYYGIGKVVDGEATLISADAMQPSDAILRGNVTNHIRASCVGETLALTVNGTDLAQVTDGDYTEGDVGLTAGSYAEGGVQVAFDNFKVVQP